MRCLFVVACRRGIPVTCMARQASFSQYAFSRRSAARVRKHASTIRPKSSARNGRGLPQEPVGLGLLALEPVQRVGAGRLEPSFTSEDCQHFRVPTYSGLIATLGASKCSGASRSRLVVARPLAVAPVERMPTVMQSMTGSFRTHCIIRALSPGSSLLRIQIPTALDKYSKKSATSISIALF